MNQYLVKKLANGRGGHIYVTSLTDNRVSLVRLGSYEEVKHCFNQMACLIAGLLMQTLSSSHSAPLRSGAPVPGTWQNHLDGNKTVGTVGELFSLAASAPLEAADDVGYLVWHGSWPYGSTDLLSGTKKMSTSMSEVGGIFYCFECKASTVIGGSAEVSAVKRAKEAIKLAKSKGYEPYEEKRLMKFLDALLSARALHFFHEVSAL